MLCHKYFELKLDIQIYRKEFFIILLRYIHDECYSVQLDPSGNYLLMGGSGDEYSYSETNPDGWQSDIWVSYLVVLDTEVLKFEVTNLH